MAIETLCQMYFYSIDRHRKRKRFLQKTKGKYRAISTTDFSAFVKDFALGLRKIGIKRGDKLAILSYNCINWAIVDYACLCMGIVTVPIYTTLTAAQCAYILKDSGCSVAVVEDAQQLEKILKKHQTLPNLRYVVTIKPTGHENIPWILPFVKVLQYGRDQNIGPLFDTVARIKPTDVATIIYTSGTTGKPKGVMLTHGNFTSNILASTSIVKIKRSDICLSFLPLSHVFERHLDYAAFFKGATIAYAESIDSVAQNMLEVKPTIVAGVPRFFEKIYRSIQDSINKLPKGRRLIVDWAINIGKEHASYMLKGKKPPILTRIKHSLAKFLVYRRIKKRLGGRIKFFISGGAALPKHIGEFLYYLNLPIIEGYGLTETSPVIAVNPKDRIKFGTVGKIIPGIEVKIAEDGEILTKGPHVMAGYYRRYKTTLKCIKDGWFHTGDIGGIDKDGYLSIIDRKKELLKTSGGKYIAPQPIENKLTKSSLVEMAMVIGEGRRFPSVLLFPNFEALEKLVPVKDKKEMLNHPDVLKEFQNLIDSVNKELAKYEQLKKFILIDETPSIAKGELTPTLKLRRSVVEKKYKEIIDKIYQEA
jgi:long-chain acyl-CoA synthetase